MAEVKKNHKVYYGALQQTIDDDQTVLWFVTVFWILKQLACTTVVMALYGPGAKNDRYEYDTILHKISRYDTVPKRSAVCNRKQSKIDVAFSVTVVSTLLLQESFLLQILLCDSC